MLSTICNCDVICMPQCTLYTARAGLGGQFPGGQNVKWPMDYLKIYLF